MLLRKDINDKRIRVLFVDENQDGTVGGSHYCLLDLMRHLDKSVFKPFVIFYESSHLVAEFKKSGTETNVYQRPKPIKLAKFKTGICRYPLRSIQILYNGIRTSCLPFFYFLFFLYRNKIQIVHINNSVFNGLEWFFAARLMRIKIVAHQRGYYRKVPKWRLRYHAQRFDYIIGISQAVRQNLLDLGISLQRYSTLYDGVNIEAFSKRRTKSGESVREEFSIPGNAPVIGVIGNLQRWKGQLTVIEAVGLLQADFPDLKCLIVGGSPLSGQEKEYLVEIENYIQRHRLSESILLTGPRNDVPDLLQALQIFIHSSLDPEPYGMVVLEAMVARKAIIASDLGGPTEMIENGVSGLLIEPGNSCLLAEKILLLLRDTALREGMEKAAYKRVCEKFVELDISKLERIYKSLVNNIY